MRWKPIAVIVMLLALNGFLFWADSFMGTKQFGRVKFLWELLGISDCLAALVAVANLWHNRHRNRLALYHTMLLGAIALQTVCVLIANITPPDIRTYPLWYVCWFWSGQWVKSFAVWMVVLFQLGFVNGVEPSH